MGPFKCPDCGVWWAGFEHRCKTVPAAPNTTAPIVYGWTCSLCGTWVPFNGSHACYRPLITNVCETNEWHC